jgi:hypothetical protein
MQSRLPEKGVPEKLLSSCKDHKKRKGKKEERPEENEAGPERPDGH